MFTHPDRLGQLARQHQRDLLAQASQRQLAHQHRLPASGTPGRAGIARRLAAAVARAAQAPGAVRSAGPHPSEPARQAPEHSN